jgi:mannose/fructose/N-acetylgalactosamine-specific phosphotransferase system component IIC
LLFIKRKKLKNLLKSVIQKYKLTMMDFINKLRFKIEVFCIDHPLIVAFGAGFILGGLIFS